MLALACVISLPSSDQPSLPLWKQVNRHTGAVKRVGILDLNLSELLSAGSAGRQRTFLFLLQVKADACDCSVCCDPAQHTPHIHGPLITQESRFNASLSLSLSFKQLGGDPLYRCPIAAKEARVRDPRHDMTHTRKLRLTSCHSINEQAETYPSPEELQLARPRSFERERQRRESSGSMGSSSSSSGGSKGSPQGSRSRRREESRDDAKDDKEEGQQRPTSLPQSGSSSFSSSSSVRHGYSRSMGAGVPPLSSSSPTRQGTCGCMSI